MRYFTLLFVTTLTLLLTGCGNTEQQQQNREFSRLFEWTTGNFSPFTEGIDPLSIGTGNLIYTPSLKMKEVDDKGTYAKIIDSNKTFNSFKEEMHTTFAPTEISPDLLNKITALQVDFNQYRILIIGFLEFPGEGFSEKITQLSAKEIKLEIVRKPLKNNLAEPSGFINIFAYQVSKKIKIVSFSESEIDMEDTSLR